MKFIHVLIGALLAIAASNVQAQSNGATLSCTAPTQNTDNSPIIGAQLPLKFKFYEGTVSGTYPNVSPLQTACNFIFTGLTAGTHFFTASAVDNKGVESAMSAPVSKPVTNAVPKAPSMLTVGVDTFAYQLAQTDNQLTLVAMGTAPAGTPCDMSQSVTDAAHGTTYLVPYSAVILPNGKPNTSKRTVFAACG